MTKIDERSPPVAIGSEERRALRSYLEEQPEVIASYLFGSQVSERPGPLSDVDLAVWLDPNIEPADRVGRQLALMSGAAAVLRTDEVDVVILNDATPLLAQRVLRERILLTERDAAGRVGLETAAIVEYLDTAPLREELGRALTQRIETGSFGRPRSD